MLTKFLLSAADARQFPQPATPEIAFLGRSNVGKSSLINSLVGSKIAKTSATPGRTQTINFFEIRRPGKPRPDWIFADLPGYGYARVPKELTAEWPKFIDPYLTDRTSLALCVCIVDVSVPPQKKDLELLNWLRHAERQFAVVGTKVDRISNNQLTNNLRKLKEELLVEEILPFSAKGKAGHDELWSKIFAASKTDGESTS
ncbi:MAG TPA: ribosome biogenesis GTP-binding protein YihA/YsxC [Candidatus Koribacter sp.]